MANPVIASSAKAALSGSTASPSIPSGITDGELLLAFCHSDQSSATLATWAASGWTAKDVSVGNNGASAQLLWKIAASEGSTATFTRTNGSGNGGVILMRITGFDATPFNAFAQQQYTSDEGTTPTITTTVDECLIIRGSSWNESKTLNTIPSGTTAVQHNDLSSNDGHVVYENQATAGATGTAVYNLSAGTSTAGITVAIQPPQGGGGTDATADLSSLTSTLSAPSLTASTQRQPAVSLNAPTLTSTTPSLSTTTQRQPTADLSALTISVSNPALAAGTEAGVALAAQSLALATQSLSATTESNTAEQMSAQVMTLSPSSLSVTTQRQPVVELAALTISSSQPSLDTSLAKTAPLSAQDLMLATAPISVSIESTVTLTAQSLTSTQPTLVVSTQQAVTLNAHSLSLSIEPLTTVNEQITQADLNAQVIGLDHLPISATVQRFTTVTLSAQEMQLLALGIVGTKTFRTSSRWDATDRGNVIRRYPHPRLRLRR